MTIEEIEKRLAEISKEIDLPDCDIEKLSAEVDKLIEEKRSLEKKTEERSALIEKVKKYQPQEMRIFSDKDEKEKMEIDSKEYRLAWLGALQGKKEQRDFAISGSPVPTLVAEKFFEKMVKVAPMLSEITLMRAAGNLAFYVQGTDNAAAKHTENASISPAADTFVKVQLGGVEFAKVLRISKAAAKMSVDSFEAWLVNILTADIAKAIENYIINDATNGIVAAGTWTTGTNQILNTATTGYTYANIVSLIGLLPAGYDSDAKFLINKKTLYGQVAQIVNSTGNPIFIKDTESGMEGKILGYPVIVDDYTSTANNAIYLGDYTQVVGNLAQEIEVEASDQSGFLNGAIDYRGFAIFDSKVANPDAIVRLVSTTN